MTNTPYRRRDLRLLEYDYATPGTYFVTICVQTRACIFGDIVDGEVRRSFVGDMIDTHLHLTEERHAGVQLDAYVIMPNHLHVLFNVGWLSDAEADATSVGDSRHGGLQLHSGDEDFREAPELTSLPRVMQWFKSATINEYIRRVRSDGHDFRENSGKLTTMNMSYAINMI